MLEGEYEEDLNIPPYSVADRITIFVTEIELKPIQNFWSEGLHRKILERLLDIMSDGREFKLQAVDLSSNPVYPEGIGIEVTGRTVSFPMLSLLCFVIRNFHKIPVASLNDVIGAETFLTGIACAMAEVDVKMDNKDKALTAFYMSTIQKKKSLLMDEFTDGMGPATYIEEVSFESAKSQTNFKNFLEEHYTELGMSKSSCNDVLSKLLDDNVLDTDEDED